MPETTENFHWIPVRDAGLFVQNSFRQITLSEDQGIHARIGKLKSDPEGSTVIQSYYFDKDKFSMEEAKKWVSEHKKSSNDEYQTRALKPEESELRLNYEKSGTKIIGYAAVFNQRTTLFPGLDEQVAPGAFTESISRDDVRALFNHNAEIVLGRTKAGTLRLWEDSKGLGYEILVDPDDDDHKKLIRKIKRGDISQSSFGFNIVDRSMETDDENKTMLRTIRKAQLFDVSPVTFAAYPQTEGLNVRMTRFEKVCVIEDEVIMLPEIEQPEPQSLLSDEQLDAEWEAIKKAAFHPRERH